jgi:hypothetical protein
MSQWHFSADDDFLVEFRRALRRSTLKEDFSEGEKCQCQDEGQTVVFLCWSDVTRQEDHSTKVSRHGLSCAHEIQFPSILTPPVTFRTEIPRARLFFTVPK